MKTECTICDWKGVSPNLFSLCPDCGSAVIETMPVQHKPIWPRWWVEYTIPPVGPYNLMRPRSVADEYGRV